MYYSKVFLQSIIVLLSLGYVVSKAGVEGNETTFSTELEIVHPWEECKKFNDTHAVCGDDLFAENAELENMKDVRYLMKIQIGTNKKEFKVSSKPICKHSQI